MINTDTPNNITIILFYRTKKHGTEISNENVPSRMKWPNGFRNSFLRCWKSSPSDNSAVENEKQDQRLRFESFENISFLDRVNRASHSTHIIVFLMMFS